MGHGILVAGVADPQTDAAISLADMGMDRPQAVMARMSAALFHPAFARGKVKLVMKDHQIGGGELVEAHGLAHRLAREVHEGFGFEERQFFLPQTALGDQPLKAAFPWAEAVIRRDAVQCHEADIVAVARVFRPRIAEAHEKFHTCVRHLLPGRSGPTDARIGGPDQGGAGSIGFISRRLDFQAVPAFGFVAAGAPKAPASDPGGQDVQTSSQHAETPRYTVVCSIRDEGPFLVEWVVWQRMLGFTDIVVVSNDCTDPSPQLLDAFEAAGWLTHLRRDVPDGQSVCARKLKAAGRLPQVSGADWVMVCDVDEFLVVHVGGGQEGGGSIADLIAFAPDPYLGMAVNWRVYGSSGIADFQDEPVHRQFLQAGRLDHSSSRWIKCIHAHPGWFTRLGEHGPKRLDLTRAGADWGAPGMRWINSAGETLKSWHPDRPYLRSLPPGETSHAVAQINHYMVKSHESFSLKRGTPSAVAGKDRYTDGYFTRHDRNEVQDRSALAYGPRFDALRAQAMALPGVARLHHLACASYIARIAAKAGAQAGQDPRYQHHLAMAGGGGS